MSAENLDEGDEVRGVVCEGEGEGVRVEEGDNVGWTVEQEPVLRPVGILYRIVSLRAMGILREDSDEPSGDSVWGSSRQLWSSRKRTWDSLDPQAS